MSVFNFTLKSFLIKILNISDGRIPYILCSVGPFFLAYVVSAVYPKVLDILGLISLVINNFNGFIIPALLRVGIYKKEV